MRCFIFMIACLMLVELYAHKKCPSYKNARRSGAMAKIELRIVNDDGVPVSNANVEAFMGMNFRPKGYFIRGLSDTN